MGVLALIAEVAALIDALRHREDAFRAAGKLTKPAWLGILAVCAAVGFVTMYQVLALPGIAALFGALVYFADVRPALLRVMGRGR